MDEPQRQLETFIDRFEPEIAALARALYQRMKARLPGAAIMVYDNFNALAIGFGASERVKQAVLSIAVYPSVVRLFFLWGRALPDPHGLLEGQGNQVRSVRVTDVALLDDPRIDALIAEAMARSEPPFDPGSEQRLVIRAVSAKQRPRRRAE